MDRGWFSRNWWIIAIGIGIAIIVGLFLNWVRETYGLNTFLTFISVVVAAFAVIVASLALQATRKSLELTRATTRPFLTYLVKDLVFDSSGKSKKATLRINVSNKGNLPAENPFLQLLQVTHRSKAGEPTGIDELRNIIPEPIRLRELLKDKPKTLEATYFPDETRQSIITFGPNTLREYQQSKCVAIAVVISYQSMQREHETIRWFLDDKESLEARFRPIPEKDYFK